MKITNETKIGELVPEGYAVTGNCVVTTNKDSYIKIQIAPKEDVDSWPAKPIILTPEIKFQDECCPSCGQYIGHAIGCIYNIAEY